MTVEILFPEACNLFGDGQNATYLQASLPDAQFVFTPLTDTPYFVNNTPDLIYIGSMTERVQRRVIEKLLPLKERLVELIDAGVVFLATGNAGEVFMNRIEYVTEELTVDGLGLFDLTVKTNLFDRYNGKVLGQCDGIDVVGFRSQFSFWYGDNTDCAFVACERGIGIHRDSKHEGARKNNLICTQLLGPLLPLNPLFCEHVIALAGGNDQAAFREEAMAAYEQHMKEFRDPAVVF
ncbi:MAG: hypothetical protein IJC52_05675 [Clostridia bacterium]|nr:hypothetical protein [Clostridia bacterium]